MQLLQAGELDHIICFDEQVDLRRIRKLMRFDALLQHGNHEPSMAELAHRATEYRMDDLLDPGLHLGTRRSQRGDGGLQQSGGSAGDARSTVTVRHDDVSLALLPLSHVYERYWSYYVLYRGGAVNAYIRDPQAVMSVAAQP